MINNHQKIEHDASCLYKVRSSRAKPSTQHLIYFVVLVLILSACNLGTVSRSEVTSTPTTNPITQRDNRLVVAWASDGDLMVWQTGDTVPRRIASGGAVQAFIAPDGERIAFTRGPQGRAETLWIVDTIGTSEQQLVGDNPTNYTAGINQVGDVVWGDERTLYFNTLQEQAQFYEPRNDLYRVDVITRQISQMADAGEGGRITLSPDGDSLITTYHGTYGTEDGVIRVHDLLEQNPAYDLFTFTGVSTASEFRFYPEIFWATDETILVALPDPDLIYDGLQDVSLEETQLWRVSTINPNDTEIIGTVDASYFSQPIWSSNGGRAMIYFATGETRNELVAYLAEQDGSNPRELYRGTIGDLDTPQWIPNSTAFVYADPSTNTNGTQQYILDDVTQEARALSTEAIFSLQFVDETRYVYVAQGDGRQEIRFATLGGESQFIGSVNGVPVFDAVWVGSN
ncbi:MAG: hypothetical protein AAF846_28075 [Chloroflexota bacterium]